MWRESTKQQNAQSVGITQDQINAVIKKKEI